MHRKRSRLEEEEECLVYHVKRACTEASWRIVEDRRREADTAEQDWLGSRAQSRRRKWCEPAGNDSRDCAAFKRSRAGPSSPVCDAAGDPAEQE